MSNLGGPISPTEQITFEIDRLLRISDADCGDTTRDQHNNNNNNNISHCNDNNNYYDVVGNVNNSNNNNKNKSNNNSQQQQVITEENFFFEKTESIASSESSASTTNSCSNNNTSAGLTLMMHNISPSLLKASNQVSIGVASTPSAANAAAFKKKQSSSNSNHNTPNLSSGSEYFAALIQAANNAENTNINNNSDSSGASWYQVSYLCDCLSNEVFQNNDTNKKREVIELVQKEFDTAFEPNNKNIKRRHVALMIVAHLFAAPHHLLSEKVFVGALYRALNIHNNNNSSTNEKSSSSSCPPLHVLLSIAKALEVGSCHFSTDSTSAGTSSLGKQHLPYFVGKLCNGLILTSPSESQHQELCDAIKSQSAVMHGFRNNKNKDHKQQYL